VSFDKETGECIQSATAPLFDAAALARDEACDGYYLLITSETGWDTNKIIETYRGLWRIEQSFKITKSDLLTRPVFVYTREHVEAHFLTCYIALVILRLMQKATDYRYSAAAMIDDLGQVSCSALEDNWWIFDYRSALTDELFALIDQPSPTRYKQTGEIRALLAKTTPKSFK
ncbi:MAG: transposase, partial [Raoultibacter sp.]